MLARHGATRDRVRQVQGGQPVQLVLAGIKARLFHTEPAEDPAVEELVEAFSGQDLDEAAHNICAVRVIPAGARFEHERQTCPESAALGKICARRYTPLEARSSIHGVHRVAVEEPVAKPRRVGEQVPDSQRLRSRPDDRLHRGASRVHADVGELRQVLRDRIAQIEASLFVEHHRGNRCDRLRHRVDAVDGVRFDGKFASGVARPVRGEVGDLPGPAHKDCESGELLSCHVLSEVLVDPLQPVGIEADIVGVDRLLDGGHAATIRRGCAPDQGDGGAPSRLA